MPRTALSERLRKPRSCYARHINSYGYATRATRASGGVQGTSYIKANPPIQASCYEDRIDCSLMIHHPGLS